MAAEDVKLIGMWASPSVVTARIALNLKGIEYELLKEDPCKKSELLLKSNPVYKKFPVLIHGGKRICKSHLIVEYIDQVWSSSGFPILPADAYDRVTSIFWATYIDDTLNSQIGELMLNEDEKSKAETEEQLFTALQLFEETFVKSYKTKTPRLVEWAECFCSVKAAKKVLPKLKNWWSSGHF
ncbi:glutathione S-transferase U18-like [Dendrobium catenatum]|uniref:glutathione S-transferase U18-like n=1 Tax=Dendrobium catenatum TaxID=906689 RepID=UPI0010A04826|nr:glutathione S-transferase U18-like [Dendrobium catenatum]